MIRELVSAGYRLSGGGDPRLHRGLALTIVEGLLAAAPLPFLYVLLNALLHGTATVHLVIGTGIGMIACLLARIVVGTHAMPLIFSGAYSMMGEARIRIAEHLQRLPMGWFNRQRSGDLATRMTADLELIENLWSHFLGVFASGVATVFFLLLFLGWLDWRLLLLVLATLPFALLALWFAQRLALHEGGQMIRANSHAQSELLDYIQGIAVIRSFGRFGPAWARVNQAQQVLYRAMVRTELAPAPWIGAFGFVIEAGFVLLMVLGVHAFLGRRISAENLLLFAILALPIFRQLNDIGISAMLLRFGRRALSRIDALLDTPALPEPETAQIPDEYSIAFDQVSFGYDKESGATIHDLSCTLPMNKMTAIVGPSGAGKSTLVHLIGRLWDVDQGAIRIGGIDLRDIGTEPLNRRVATVFQDVALFSGSVLDNLRIGNPLASRDQVEQAARLAHAHTFIEQLPYGYDTILAENGQSLSGGERQRLSIARALLKNAPILLLDEATASVDPSAAAEIQDAFNALVRHRTVVVVAHRLHSVMHADQILVMEQGRLAESGRHADLLAAEGLYARLWQRQQQAQHWRLPGHASIAALTH